MAGRQDSLSGIQKDRNNMPPKRSQKTAIDFQECVRGITQCKPGQERNMYPFIRDLFVRFFGFNADAVFTDTAIEHGGVPDVAVIAPTGVLDAKGKEIESRWLVLEAKDEPEIFLNESQPPRHLC